MSYGWAGISASSVSSMPVTARQDAAEIRLFAAEEIASPTVLESVSDKAHAANS